MDNRTYTRGSSRSFVENSANQTQTISLFTLNCYLLPALFVNYDNRTCTNQRDRADKIGQLCAEHDIIGLQEVWGTNVDCIEKHLRDDFQVPYYYQNWNVFGWGSTLFTTAMFYLQKNGGLWCASKNDIPLQSHVTKQYGVSATKSAKGISLSVHNMKNRWNSDSYLLLFNTHLDTGLSPRTQVLQLKELATFISDSCERLSKELDVKSHQIGVIIIGDLNFDPSHSQYEQCFTTFHNKLRDAFADLPKKGLTYEANNSLNPWNENARLDHIFALDEYFDGSTFKPLLKLEFESVRIVKQPKGEELSDHWGQITKFKPK